MTFIRLFILENAAGKWICKDKKVVTEETVLHSFYLKTLFNVRFVSMDAFVVMLFPMHASTMAILFFSFV